MRLLTFNLSTRPASVREAAHDVLLARDLGKQNVPGGQKSHEHCGIHLQATQQQCHLSDPSAALTPAQSAHDCNLQVQLKGEELIEIARMI